MRPGNDRGHPRGRPEPMARTRGVIRSHYPRGFRRDSHRSPGPHSLRADRHRGHRDRPAGRLLPQRGRLPGARRLSVSTPRSFCPTCDRQLAWWENIPVVSWLALRGRCHTCKRTDLDPVPVGGGGHRPRFRPRHPRLARDGAGHRLLRPGCHHPRRRPHRGRRSSGTPGGGGHRYRHRGPGPGGRLCLVTRLVHPARRSARAADGWRRICGPASRRSGVHLVGPVRTERPRARRLLARWARWARTVPGRRRPGSGSAVLSSVPWHHRQTGRVAVAGPGGSPDRPFDFGGRRASLAVRSWLR